MKKQTRILKLYVVALIILIAIAAMFSCSPKVYTITDTKMFHEVYVKANESQKEIISRRCMMAGKVKPEIVANDGWHYTMCMPHYYLNMKVGLVWMIPRQVSKTQSNEY